jgi:nitric oxide reductase large subunit
MFQKLFVVASVVALSASSALAAIDATTQTAIQSGITGADATYYAIGGTVLIVMAGIWGFKRVKSLLGN